MRVDRVELAILRLPLVKSFETSFGRMDAREFVLVTAADAGARGFGECVADADPFYSSETTATAALVLSKYLVPAVLGRTIAHPREVGALFRHVRGHRMAKGAIEMALWDLFARQSGRPLHEVLGAPRRPIAAGVSIGIQPSIDALLDRIAEELAAGYRRVKIKIKPEWDLAPVEAIRAKFPTLPLMVDANAAYSLDAAPTLAALDRFDLMMIEQPLDYDDLVQHAHLQKLLRTPICLDESIKSPQTAADALTLGACRIINIKPGRMGGLTPSVAVHDLCVARGIPVWHGGMLESGIGRAHNLHLSTLPGFTLPGDVAASRRYFVPDLIEPPIDVGADGMIEVPPGPGIGVMPVPERVTRATLHSEEYRVRSLAWPLASSALIVAILAPAGCKTPPPALPKGAPTGAAAAPGPAAVTTDKKMGWIYRLEQQRVLRDATPPTDPAATRPDLVVLAKDPDPVIRARAAVALGRVGLPDAVPVLVALLADTDEYTRAMAAFGLGISGSKDAVTPLQTALADTAAFVRARVIDALGLLGTAAAAAAPAIADASSGCKEKLATLESDDEEYPKKPEIEACRAALFALVRLQKYDALARLVLDAQGQPISTWWPVAYALQRINDPKAAPALQRLLSSPGVYAPSFALRGLTTLKDKSAVPAALGLAARPSADIRLRVVAVRALGQIGGAAGVDALITLLEDQTTPRNLALEAVTALGAAGDARAFDLLLERMRDPWPSMRSAATIAAIKVKPDSMLLLIPSFGPDADWSVRASLATALGSLPADAARGAIEDLTVDADMRVRSAALEALAKIGAPDLATRLFDALEAPDFAVRATAARLIGEKTIEFGVERLTVAYNRGDSDATYTARAAALDALAKFGTDPAKAVLRRGLNDRDWPVRLKAADLLRGLGDATAAAVRPAPVRQANDFFESPRILHPRYSPHAFIDTKYGTIEIELNVVEAPVTTAVFIDLARAGFFNGIKVHRLVPNFVIQTGDPRGDGEGGPGYTIRDELSPQPYLRGTVGMALDGPDTGGSQFFIAVSPQPHLDGRYTVFGRVVKGDEILDLISQWDVIDAVRIWDGVGI